MDGYNILIPSVCRETSPELTLPIMDALQATGHTPVIMDMGAMAAMYQDMRYERHGCYEIFEFYVRDMLREGKVDFGLSVGLGMILEDPSKHEAHNLLEESGIPSMIYLHLRDMTAVEKLNSIQAQSWNNTFFVCSTATLAQALKEQGFGLTEHMTPGTSSRLFYPQHQPPADAAFSILTDDWATQDYDVSFVGSYSPLRDSLLTELADAGIRLAIFGDAQWKKVPQLASFYRNHARYLQDVNTIYNYSKISLDLPYSETQPEEYVSCRVFDCLASNSFMLTHARPALAAALEPNFDIASYEPGELLKSVKYYLNSEVDRVAFCGRGYRRVLGNHLWKNRLASIIPRLEMHLLQTAVR